MRAVHLERVGDPARVREVDVPSYTREVFSGALAYDLPVPLVPGPTCVGVVDQVAEDVFHLNRGDVVPCNSFYSSGDADGADDILIGWTGNGTERSARIQRIWRRAPTSTWCSTSSRTRRPRIPRRPASTHCHPGMRRCWSAASGTTSAGS
ncbi:hypothetical protein [Actinoallomurus acaciae]|uniref:Alcohol dehydrogenase N-terminal domain-containing protein n=1 Tax=Actinoallomurus acaciae TaxID=502577 RepID=A0ABV5YI06_9ACTN